LAQPASDDQPINNADSTVTQQEGNLMDRERSGATYQRQLYTAYIFFLPTSKRRSSKDFTMQSIDRLHQFCGKERNRITATFIFISIKCVSNAWQEPKYG
jgi:hypothetical protein